MVKNPAIPIAITAMTTPTLIVKIGYWKSWLIDWKLFTPAISPPSSIQKKTTPSDIEKPSAKQRRRLSATALSPMIFKGMTGNTQGVRFRSSPPSAATSSRRRKPPPPATSTVNANPKTSNSMTSGALTPLRIFPKTVGSNASNTGSSSLLIPLAPTATISSEPVMTMSTGARQTRSSQA